MDACKSCLMADMCPILNKSECPTVKFVLIMEELDKANKEVLAQAELILAEARQAE